MLCEPVLEHPHQVGGGGVAERLHPTEVFAGEHEDLVDATRFGSDVDGAQVVHGEGFGTGESRVEVGQHPHLPTAALIEALQRRGGRLLVAGAERARPVGIGFVVGRPGGEV
jgi:hypothetical protein